MEISERFAGESSGPRRPADNNQSPKTWVFFADNCLLRKISNNLIPGDSASSKMILGFRYGVSHSIRPESRKLSAELLCLKKSFISVIFKALLGTVICAPFRFKNLDAVTELQLFKQKILMGIYSLLQ